MRGASNTEGGNGAGSPTLLGYPPGTRLVTFTCDEFGESHASTAAVIEAMEAGLGIRPYAVGATVQMPGAWVPQVVQYAVAHPQADIGVHLTIESGLAPMKMRPLCSRREVPGLYSPQGFLWDTARDAWAHASEDEIYTEARTQLEAALGAGLDVTHLDGHGNFQGANPAGYCRIAGRLAAEFRLPLRIAPRWRYERQGLTAHRDGVLARGVIACDDDTNQGMRPRTEQWKTYYLRRLAATPPGLTDYYIHPSLDTAELRGLLGEAPAASRVEQYQLLLHDGDFRTAIQHAAQNGLRFISWREVRDFQRQQA